MSEQNSRQQALDAVVRRIHDLSEGSIHQLSQFVTFLKWQEELWQSLLDEEPEAAEAAQTLIWKYDLLEAFPEARQAATRSPSLMEIKVDTATCGMIRQPALWQHPPVVGSAVVEYHVDIPAEIDQLFIRFAAGIRDGALMEGENFCAFRVYINGMRIWSTTKQSSEWERHRIELPNLAGRSAVIQLMTDSLGDARWNWAVWAEPQLLGFRTESTPNAGP